MSARILDGRQMARQIVDEIRITVECLVSRGHSPPVVAVVRVGEDPASVRYASQIERLVASAGMGFRPAVLPVSADDDLLGQTLGGLSSDRAITGILLQFPLPAHLSREKAVAAIAPGKDIDGVTPLNAGHFFTGRGRYFVPATPLGGLELLQRSAIPIDGRHAVIVGRSEIVGRPMALLLLRENATITICHSRTPDLARYTRQADILAVAVGHPGLITGEMVAPGAVVLDFGVNVVNGKVVGDVDFASAVDVAGAITPVPGGTGPMTNAMLLSNILRAARWLGSHKQAEGRAD